MLSIGNLAKLAKVSARTLRYYESIGLISSAQRAENNYRYYDSVLVEKIARIKELQELGFQLEEIKDVLQVSSDLFVENLRRKLGEVEGDLHSLGERRERIKSLLLVSEKIETGDVITETERGQYMEAIKEEIIQRLKNRYGQLSEAHYQRINHESDLYETAEKQSFLKALRDCLDFAEKRKLRLGPGRGSSSASLVYQGLGLTAVNPAEHDLLHERLLTQPPNIHIDVEFERGQEFVDYCRSVSRTLSYGEINAFKMPLLDIIKNVHARVGQEIDYDLISDDSDLVMGPFQRGDVEKIFSFDMSDDALIMLWERHKPQYRGLDEIIKYTKSQKIYNFRDVTNITAVWRPFCQEMVDRIESYREAKTTPFCYDFLRQDLQEYLKPNFGHVLYHEDLMRIISAYTGWGYERCNNLRRALMRNSKEKPVDLELFKKLVSKEVADLVIEESKWAFCQPHAVAFARLTKQTAILKSLHQEIYYQEIDKWEQKHGYRWDDVGVKFKGVSILQD